MYKIQILFRILPYLLTLYPPPQSNSKQFSQTDWIEFWGLSRRANNFSDGFQGFELDGGGGEIKLTTTVKIILEKIRFYLFHHMSQKGKKIIIS